MTGGEALTAAQRATRVKKVGGDYDFNGVIVSCFVKRRNNAVRCVVENDEGILHIFNPSQLEAFE